MKKHDPNRISFMQAMAMNYRAFTLIHREIPNLFLAKFLSCLAQTLTPYSGIWFSAQILNELAGNRNPQRLAVLAILSIFITAGLALASVLLQRWEAVKSTIQWQTHRHILTKKLMTMDFADIDNQKTHDLISQISQNATWRNWGLGRIIWPYFDDLVKSFTQIIVSAALTVTLFTSSVTNDTMIWLDHPLVAIFVLLFLLGITLLAPACDSQAESRMAARSSEAKLGNRFFSFYGFMAATDRRRAADIRMYNQQEICDYYAMKERTFFPGSRIARDMMGSIGLLYTLSAALSVVFTGLVYIYVCLKAWGGAFGVGSVTQYIGVITTFSQGIALLAETIGSLITNAQFLNTTFTFLDIPNAMYQGSLTTEKRSDRKYEVEFRDVSFRYPGSEQWALRHVNMKFTVGQRLAVVGMNGSGKTTFIKLLCRLYDPQEGEILLNGINIKKYNYDDYMGIFSVVFQDFQLLAFPLGENVAAGRNYDRIKAADCLRKAGFGDRLDALPLGLDTPLYREIAQDGIDISGGEAQKIAIARALYKDAPFIILDEPTAALDPIAEAEIYKSFNDIIGDKTAVYISHRLSSCRFCDEILVFDGGRIVQQGSHDALVEETGGKYHELWTAQAQYYTKTEE